MNPRPAVKAVFLLAVLGLAAACQSNPKVTVLNLDTTDPKWNTRRCIAHRKAAADYNDGERARAVVGLADFAAPLVGTAASTLLSWRKDPQRLALNERIQRDCISANRRTIVRNGRPTSYRARPYTPARR